ncbi:MAG: pyridoxal phosphate-dependent aminotransferase [Nitrospinae bacterium]|nr:pyridoxal phosphate-dependent aminotransferase [Nitrospinota bacterium]
MPISGKIAEMMERSSWIRRMFEEGARLKAQVGEENVFDFTLGNPVGEPPEEVAQELARLASERGKGAHRYMPNAGLPEARAKIAGYLKAATGLPFGIGNVIMTVGAGGALNVIIKALCAPGDEMVILAPYFAEYNFYADNHNVSIKVARTTPDFQIDAGEIEKAITPRTRVVLLNSPNNPTGAIYPADALAAVSRLLAERTAEYGRKIYLVMDEPYRKLTYDNVTAPNVFLAGNNVIVATSHSKDLNLPGERIGYIAIHPEVEHAGRIFDAMTLAIRILGFVNAPALFQRLVAGMQDVAPDMSVYAENRRILLDGLAAAGYGITPPMGGFYIFAKSPVPDDVEFVNILKSMNTLVVPGSGFGAPGYFRIAFCCAPETCRGALPAFAEAIRQAREGSAPDGKE